MALDTLRRARDRGMVAIDLWASRRAKSAAKATALRIQHQDSTHAAGMGYEAALVSCLHQLDAEYAAMRGLGAARVRKAAGRSIRAARYAAELERRARRGDALPPSVEYGPDGSGLCPPCPWKGGADMSPDEHALQRELDALRGHGGSSAAAAGEKEVGPR